jgi:ATP-dependent RNA helicase DHX37/DHR1
MSATLRVSDFIENHTLFPLAPPVVEVASRQYPVTTHFSRKTVMMHEFIDRTFGKIVKAHSQLPSGGILVFLTGRQEIEVMCTKLRKRFSNSRKPTATELELKKKKWYSGHHNDDNNDDGNGTNEEKKEDASDDTKKVKEVITMTYDLKSTKVMRKVLSIDFTSSPGMDEYAVKPPVVPVSVDGKKGSKKAKQAADEAAKAKKEADELAQKKADAAAEAAMMDLFDSDDDDDGEERRDRSEEKDGKKKSNRSKKAKGRDDDSDDDKPVTDEEEKPLGPVRVLPLYSLLPTHLQMRVFEPLPEGERLIVLATNVAETSLTIPGIKYVIDPGREKKKVYDKVTGTSRFVIDWISKASANQRAGRAGMIDITVLTCA